MSLIHDALERARRDRERQAARERGETPPALPPPPEYRFRSPAWIVAAVAAVALAALAVGWLAGRRPAAEEGVSKPVPGEERAVDPGGVETEVEGAAAEGEIGPKVDGTEGGTAEAATSGSDRPITPSPEASGSASAATATESRARPRPAQSEAASGANTDRATEPASTLPEATRPPARQAPTQPRSTVPESTATDPPFRLSGIAWSESSPLAVIDGALLAVGETIEGWTVVEVRRRSVLLERDDESLELSLPSPTG